MKPKIYYSIPVSICMSKIHPFIAKYTHEFDQTYWSRNTSYTNIPIQDCDIFVIVLPDCSWKYKREFLPTGCQRELKLAIELGKSIYIAYYTADKIPTLYKADVSISLIQGIPGTSTNIHREKCKNESVVDTIIRNSSTLPCVNPDVIFNYDRRLLLSLL